MMRLMSGEIKGDQDMILLLSKKNAEERLAAFIYNLSRRFAERGFSPREFRLTMTRGDIGNYLGLTVETISRLLGRFQKSGMLGVKGKYITIENGEALAVLAGHATHQRDRQRLIPLPDQHFTEIVDPARFCCCSVSFRIYRLLF